MATILGLQPRILSTAVGMTSDEIIESMVMQFLRLIPEFINLEKHKTDLFQVMGICMPINFICWGLIASFQQLDEKGRMNSLSTVFLQEVERYNKLLQLLRVCIYFNVFKLLNLIYFISDFIGVLKPATKSNQRICGDVWGFGNDLQLLPWW